MSEEVETILSDFHAYLKRHPTASRFEAYYEGYRRAQPKAGENGKATPVNSGLLPSDEKILVESQKRSGVLDLDSRTDKGVRTVSPQGSPQASAQTSVRGEERFDTSRTGTGSSVQKPSLRESETHRASSNENQYPSRNERERDQRKENDVSTRAPLQPEEKQSGTLLSRVRERTASEVAPAPAPKPAIRKPRRSRYAPPPPQFKVGERVRMTGIGMAKISRTSLSHLALTGTIESVGDALLVLVDGQRFPNRWHPSYWEKA